MPETPLRILMPPHAYVPGQNARHPENWFDTIKASVREDIALDDLEQTAAWRVGIMYFKAGYFWECHEVLEAVWLKTPASSDEREIVQAIIQLANARLKLRMHKPRATLRLCEMVRIHLARCPMDLPILRFNVDVLISWVVETESIARARVSEL